MTEKEKIFIKKYLEEKARKYDYTYDELLDAIQEEAQKENISKYQLVQNIFSCDYSTCKLIAECYECSTAAIYKCWRKHKKKFDYKAFFADIEKIKPYTAAIPAVPYNWYNSFIFNELLFKNINK